MYGSSRKAQAGRLRWHATSWNATKPLATSRNATKTSPECAHWMGGRRARTKPLWSAQIPRPACAPGAPRLAGTARHFPPDQRQSLGGSRTPRWRAAALRNPWNLSSSFKTLITSQHSKAKCPADLEETVQWQSAVLSPYKENSQKSHHNACVFPL